MDIYRWLVEQEQDLLYLVEQAYRSEKMSEQQFQPGEPVWWEDQLYLTGYTGAPVKSVFVMWRKAKVRNAGIAVQMRNGEWLPKWVAAKNVKLRI